MSRFLKSAAFVLAAALLLGVSAGRANAATILHSGQTVDGWKISFPAGVQLVSDDGKLKLEKFAAFTNTEGFVITFTQVSYTAGSVVNFVNESLTNVSGETWSGFQHLLLNTLPGNAPDAKFTSAFGPTPDSFFTHVTLTDDVITHDGGLVQDTDTIKFGFGAEGGDMMIAANPATSGMKKVFSLKEVPIVGVPLPAAVWSGLSSLLGLGLAAHGKRIKKALA